MDEKENLEAGLISTIGISQLKDVAIELSEVGFDTLLKEVVVEKRTF